MQLKINDISQKREKCGMAAQANFHPIFLNESWHGPSFTYLLAPPVVGLPLRPPPAPCCAVEKCFQNMPPILT